VAPRKKGTIGAAILTRKGDMGHESQRAAESDSKTTPILEPRRRRQQYEIKTGWKRGSSPLTWRDGIAQRRRGQGRKSEADELLIRGQLDSRRQGI